MSARVSSGAHAGASALHSEGHASVGGAAARATALLEPGSSAGAADNDPGSQDAGTDGAGAGASRHFAAALANAGRSGATGASAKPTPAAAPSASLSNSGSQPPGDTSTSSSSSSSSTETAALAAAAVAAAAGAGTTDATAASEPAECADDTSFTESGVTAGSGAGHSGHRGRGAAAANTAGNDPWGALALLQGNAAALAAAWQAPALGNDGPLSGSDNGGGDAAGDSASFLGAISGSGASAASGNPPAPAAAVGDGASARADSSLGGLLMSGADAAGMNAAMRATAGNGSSDASGAAGAATRAATLLPQFLSAIPVAAGSASIARAIAVPMSDPSWPQALAAQVHWMAGSQVQSATLRLSPEHLGPIQVRIELQQSQINVNFSAAHADTRAALADAVPRLREMLAAGGLSLGQATVQQEAPGGGSARSQTASNPQARGAMETVDPVAVGAGRALGLLDEYA